MVVVEVVFTALLVFVVLTTTTESVHRRARRISRSA